MDSGKSFPESKSLYMNRIDAFITPHIGDKQFQCDDQFALNLQECRFAIADGSSSDFFSKLYSRILADSFVKFGENLYTKDTIEHLNCVWRSEVLQKLEDAGCRPGSFPFVRYQKRDPGCSTIIGLSFKIDERESPSYICSGLGDSVLFFIPQGDDLPNFQFSSDSDSDFSFKPDVTFGYTPVIANSYSSAWLENIRVVERKLDNGIFILVTDGLAEWLLHSHQIEELKSRFKRVISISSQDEFEKFISEIRRNEGAKNDDMTLLKLYISDKDNIKFDLTDSQIYDYRRIASQEEAFEKELKRESSEIKRKLEAQNAISLAASEVKLKKEIGQNYQTDLDKQLRLAREEKDKEIRSIQDKHAEELKQRELAIRTQVISELKAEFKNQECSIREDERIKTIGQISKSNISVQAIIDSKRQEWEKIDLPRIIEETRKQWQQTVLKQAIEEAYEKWVHEELPRLIADARIKWENEDLQLAIDEAHSKWENEELPIIIENKENEWISQHSIKKKITSFIKTKKGKFSCIALIAIIIMFIGLSCFNSCNKQVIPAPDSSSIVKD